MIKIRLDKDRILEYDIDALLDLEEETQMPVFNLFQNQQKMFSVKTILILLKAGLKKHENLSYDEVKSLFALKQFTYIIEKVTEAISEAMGTEAEPVKKKQGRPAKEIANSEP